MNGIAVKRVLGIPAKIASLFRAPFALRKGRGSMARGLGTGLGNGVVYGFWVPASAGMTGVAWMDRVNGIAVMTGLGIPRENRFALSRPLRFAKGAGLHGPRIGYGGGKGVVYGFWGLRGNDEGLRE